MKANLLLQKSFHCHHLKISEIIADEDKSAYKRYLDLWKTLKSEDKDIAFVFDNLRRSTALQQLARWKFNDLMTDEENEDFSAETHEKVNAFREAWQYNLKEASSG